MLQKEVEKLISLKSEGAPIETGVDALRSMVARFSGTLEFGKASCRDPLRNFVINPRGDVTVCGCSPSIGNIRQHAAKAIWSGEAARKARLTSLGCSVKVATESCTTHRTIIDDVRRAMLLLGLRQ